MKYPDHLLKLINLLRRLPGVGSKSAERYAFHILDWTPKQLHELANTLIELPQKIKHCHECGCLMQEPPCHFCNDTRQSSGSLCIIASARDVYPIDATHEFHGLYHVLGGLLSPMDGFGPDQLNLDPLKQRIQKHNITEIVIALDSTLEGDATALYLKKELEPMQLKVTRLAFGLPMGSSIDYVDGGTLARAFIGRGDF